MFGCFTGVYLPLSKEREGGEQAGRIGPRDEAVPLHRLHFKMEYKPTTEACKNHLSVVNYSVVLLLLKLTMWSCLIYHFRHA